MTIYIADYPLEDNQAFIDPINEEMGILDKLKELGIILETHGTRKINYGDYTLASFNLDRLKDYDSFGVKRFYKNFDIYDSNKKLDYDQLVESDMDFKTKSGYYLHFHPNDEGYDFTYYDADKKLIDGGILETNIFVPLKDILEGIAGLISRPEIDESLKDLTHINGLEQLSEEIEEKINI